jgi:hypothetical protein
MGSGNLGKNYLNIEAFLTEISVINLVVFLRIIRKNK